jgi:hypothetical protein
MPANTPIPTVTTGGVISAATINATAVLNTCAGLYGIGGMLSGSAVAVTAPNWQMMGGQLTVAFTSGLSAAINFPNTFSAGVLTVQAIPFDSGVPIDFTLNLTGLTVSAFSLGATNSGSSYTGSITVSWFAVGC